MRETAPNRQHMRPRPARARATEKFETCLIPRHAPESGPTGEVDMAAGDEAMLVTTCAREARGLPV